MKDNKVTILEHRKIYPLPFEQICKMSSFEQILGKTKDTYNSQERRKRWEKALSFESNIKKYWKDCSACIGCFHLDENEAWCDLENLPCTVNPPFTFTTGMIGLACRGLSRKIIK